MNPFFIKIIYLGFILGFNPSGLQNRFYELLTIVVNKSGFVKRPFWLEKCVAG